MAGHSLAGLAENGNRQRSRKEPGGTYFSNRVQMDSKRNRTIFKVTLLEPWGFSRRWTDFSMNRRHFIGLAKLILLNSLLATKSPAAVVKKRVIVIGAGLAGLAAARDLKARGHEVVVIEGRDRIGGRIWTGSKWPELPVDLGASWIHGTSGNPLTAIARRIKARMVATSLDDAITYNTSGSPITDADERRIGGLRKQLVRALNAQAGKDDAPIRDLADAVLEATDGSPETERFLNFILSGEIEAEYAGSVESLSAHWHDASKSFPGKDVLFPAGYRVITDYLAANLQIELQQKVTTIDWTGPGVRVVTDKGEFTADRIIVTLPLGVLKAGTVQFTPALPAEKTDAIAKLGMGVLNKCYLRFAAAFWPDDVDWLEYIPEQFGEWTEWVSLQKALSQPVLLGFNAGDVAASMEAWTDQQIIDSAMQTLRTIYGPEIPDPVDFQITRWASDPFAYGSYSFQATGSRPAMRTTLAGPLEKRLYFAGEATSRSYFSTAHGAYLSGQRAAREVRRR
jgi:monoamine oxidase